MDVRRAETKLTATKVERASLIPSLDQQKNYLTIQLDRIVGQS